MKLAIFGDKTFVDDLLQKLELPPASAVTAVGYDDRSLQEALEAGIVDTVVLDEWFEDAVATYADLYRDVKFHLVVEAITPPAWRRAAAARVALVRRDRLADVLLHSLPRDVHRHRLAPEVVRQAGEELADSRAGGVKTVKQQVLAVYSAKGGVGKTTTAVSLAVLLARWGQKAGLKVALVDADFNAPAVGVWLPTAGVNTLSWRDVGPSPPWAAVQELFLLHDKSGLYYLPAPKPPEGAHVTPALLDGIRTVCLRHFDVLIFDLNAELNDITLTVLQSVYTILLVCAPALTAVTKQREFVRSAAPAAGVDLSKLRLVVNEVQAAHYRAADIADALRIPLVARLPHSRHVPEAENSAAGLPPPLARPNSPFSIGIMSLARACVGQEVETQKSGLRPFDFLRRRGVSG